MSIQKVESWLRNLFPSLQIDMTMRFVHLAVTSMRKTNFHLKSFLAVDEMRKHGTGTLQRTSERCHKNVTSTTPGRNTSTSFEVFSVPGTPTTDSRDWYCFVDHNSNAIKQLSFERYRVDCQRSNLTTENSLQRTIFQGLRAGRDERGPTTAFSVGMM